MCPYFPWSSLGVFSSASSLALRSPVVDRSVRREAVYARKAPCSCRRVNLTEPSGWWWVGFNAHRWRRVERRVAVLGVELFGVDGRCLVERTHVVLWFGFDSEER